MEKPRNPVAEDLKEIAWAVLVFDVIVVGAGVAVWLAAELPAAMWLFGGAAVLLTAFVGLLVLGNVLVVWAWDRWRAHRGADEFWRPPRARRSAPTKGHGGEG